jgi:cytochrome c-type biogenesis protein CcmF
MVPTVGRLALLLALAICVYGACAAVYGARSGRAEWVRAGRRSIYSLAAVLTFAFAILELAFLRSDFALNAVADTSSRSTPAFYKAAAVWSSQEGSLLLWAWLLSMWSSLALYLTRDRLREVASYATAILLGFGGFFVGLMVFYANPFATTSPAPAEGAGLDPLLRFPTMMIHPPMLYSGYTLCTIPFAFAAGALLARRPEGGAGPQGGPSRAPLLQSDGEWIAVIRRFALASWLFLGVGILLGASWSYAELGWGGYWGWDAVENASLLPWLTGTAFIHSLMIQERRGMLKVWNVSLALATGTLAIMGTFLVRSGILDSIHAFGGATLGVPFLVLITILIAGSIYLVVSRRERLASSHRLDSLISREAIFLFNNIVLVGLAFVIFWGTWFPKISEALTGQAASVGEPWFDRYTVPLALILVLLSGLAPLLAWRRASLAGLRRNLVLPLAAGLLTVTVLLVAGVAHKVGALIMFGCAAFVLAVVAQEFWRGTRVRRAASGEAVPLALLRLVTRNRRRYGGYIVHAGIAVLFVGVAASSSFQHVSELSLSPGQSTRVGAYTVHYVRPTATVSAANDTVHTGSTLDVGALLSVTKNGRRVATLHPSEGFYESQETSLGSVGRLIGGQPVSHVSMDPSLGPTLWSAIAPELESPRLKRVIDIGNRTIPMSRPDEGLFAIAVLAREYLRDPPPAQFHLLVSPLVMWIWIGGLIVFGGGLLALTPSLGTMRRRALARGVRRRLAGAGSGGAGLQPARAGVALPVELGAPGETSAAAARTVAAQRNAARARAGELADLEAAREVKYRELRELELDYATGKLSRGDYAQTGATLRLEALAVLDRIEALTDGDGDAPAQADAREDGGVPAGVG